MRGLIGYFGLEEWWLSAFSDSERRYINERYQPLGSSGGTLISGDISYTSQTAMGFLQNLASWFSGKNDRPIGYKILAKAEELANEKTPVLDRHFLYQTKLELHYKDRESPEHRDQAIAACLQQIRMSREARDAWRAEFGRFGSLSLPSHKGYEQLAIILEKEMKFREAIELCAEADRQGWRGNWQHRIERCRKRLAKTQA